MKGFLENEFKGLKAPKTRKLTCPARYKDEFINGYFYVVNTSLKGDLLPDYEEVWLKREDYRYDEDACARARSTGYSLAWAKGYATADLLLQELKDE